MIVLLACAEPAETGKPSESADMDSPHDSGVIVPETADTAADSGDSGDSGADTETVPPPCDRGLAWTSVAAGMGQTCGIHEDGCAECWGLGEEDSEPLWDTGGYHWSGEDIPPTDVYKSIVMIRDLPDYFNRMHTCGMTEDNSLRCWGDNTHGETDVPEGSYIDAAPSGHRTWAITDAGAMMAWGDAALPPDGSYMSVSVGRYEVAAIRADGGLTVWFPESGELVLEQAGPYTAVAAAYPVCARTTYGGLDCQIFFEDQSGSWDELLAEAPTSGVASYCLVDTNAGFYLNEDGSPGFFGYDAFNDGADIPMPAGRTFTQIACGNQHVCGLTPGGEIVCWGNDFHGETIVPS